MFTLHKCWNGVVSVCKHQQQKNLPLLRFISGAPSYEGSGQTTINDLNKQIENVEHLRIVSYSQRKFRLSSGEHVFGPVIIFPNAIFGWKIKFESLDEPITPASLSILSMVSPVPDCVVVGCGNKMDIKRDVIGKLQSFAKEVGVQGEFIIQSTHDAIPLYNFMVADGRRVVGCFIPPMLNEEEDETLRNISRASMESGEPLMNPVSENVGLIPGNHEKK